MIEHEMRKAIFDMEGKSLANEEYTQIVDLIIQSNLTLHSKAFFIACLNSHFYSPKEILQRVSDEHTKIAISNLVSDLVKDMEENK